MPHEYIFQINFWLVHTFYSCMIKDLYNIKRKKVLKCDTLFSKNVMNNERFRVFFVRRSIERKIDKNTAPALCFEIVSVKFCCSF